MSMSKKDFIALADCIKEHNSRNPFGRFEFTRDQIEVLADFCRSQNPNFKRDRWLGYIAGENGKNGGAVKSPNGGQGKPVCTTMAKRRNRESNPQRG